MPGSDPLLSTTLAAAALGVTRWTVNRWIRDGDLEAVRIHGRYYVRLSVLEAFPGPLEPNDGPVEADDDDDDDEPGG